MPPTALCPSVQPSVPLSRQPLVHPWVAGQLFESPGAHLTYRIIGPCCRLYDRDQLPWPCCRIQWRSKEPSWRRIGKRLIADMATRKHPSYSVEIVGQSYRSEPVVMTMYTVKLSAQERDWWHTKRLQPGHKPQPIAQTSIKQADSRQSEPASKTTVAAGKVI